jgi:xylan 1,4-beta-xylosidase
MGFNTCHAPIVMRSDVQQHMRMAHDELGMQYWRCHGTLSDDLDLYKRLGSSEPRCHFSGLARVIDAALAAGVRPFLELSFMPRALARDPSQVITHYKGITSPPVDFKSWGKLIRQTVEFLCARYGRAELRKWYFEIWNEPNIGFWRGTRDEYFQLYRHAALAIKHADSSFRVGGPATARGEWIPETLRFCRDSRTPIDFVSTHIYPSDVAFVDSAEGNVELKGMRFLWEHFDRVEKEVAAYDPKLPIIWGEWNSSAGPLAENHDSCNNAPLVAGALAGMARHAHGSLYWNLSDIYEECEYHFRPYHGGYGLYTVDGIAKSAARAFELMHRLLPRQMPLSGLPENPARGALATCDPAREKLAILFWNHSEHIEIDEHGHPIPAKSDHVGTTKTGLWKTRLDLGRWRPRHGHITRILPGAGSAYESWVAMQSPDNLTSAQLRRLQKASLPRVEKMTPRPGTPIDIDVPVGTVALMTLESS